MTMRLVPALTLLMVSFTSLVPLNGVQAQCDSTDFAILCYDGTMVNDAVFSCGFSCFLSSDITTCFANCIAAAVPEMSAGCVGCFADQSTCVTNSCFFPCAFGSEADCEACVAANCQSGFETCAGIVDADADGESTVCDCDDENPAVYPGAPGTGEGIDNNCDGLLALEEELACILDLNGDGLIAVSDILLLLSDFGCLVDCENDLNGDGAITVSDMLTLLSSFGTDC